MRLAINEEGTVDQTSACHSFSVTSRLAVGSRWDDDLLGVSLSVASVRVVKRYLTTRPHVSWQVDGLHC